LRRSVRNGLRIAAAALVIGSALAVALFGYRGAIDPIAIRDAIAGSRAAPAIFIGLQIVASLLFIPRTILGIAAGLIFGFALGSLWAILGAMAGAAAGFAVARWIGGGDVNLDAIPRLGPAIARAERGGWRAVAITRLIPLPHSVVNTALALTTIPWSDYLIGSFLGMLPMTLVQVDIGAAGGQALQGGSGWKYACLFLALGLAASFLIKRTTAKRTGANRMGAKRA
jgi:uncharacterized membrane protein YdjX (TVP38/TMEM64 family)